MTKDDSLKTLLLVEDEILIAMAEARMLQQHGYRVICVHSGEEALKLIETSPEIDLILMDINLGSGIDGTQAAEAILQCHDLPLVFLSSHTERQVVERTEGITSYGYVVKNTGETVLLASIQMAFRLFESRRQERLKEARLRESEALYSALLHSAMDGFWMSNLQGDLLDVNETYARMSGYSQQELRTMNIRDLEAAENPQEVIAHINKLILTGQDRFETRHRRKDGSAFPVEASIQYRPDRGGCTVGFMRDITDRKEAEAQARAVQERYRYISSLTSDIAYSCTQFSDGDFAIDWLSGAAEAITGYTADELIAMSCWGHLVIEEDMPRFKQFVIGLTACETGNCELRIRAKDGSIHWLHSKAECAPDNNENSIHRLFGGLVDITERKRAEEALERANTILQQEKSTLAALNRLITLANMAQDLPYLYETIIEQSLQMLGYDAGGIYLLDENQEKARVVYSRNIPPAFLARVSEIPIRQAPYNRVFISQQPIFTEHFEQVAPDRAVEGGFLSLACVPLLSHGRVIGTMNLASRERHSVSEGERQTLLSIGQETGSILERLTAENDLKNAATNLETLFNSIDEMVFILDMQGNIIWVNETVLKRLHYSLDELMNSNVLFLHVPERRDEALQNVMGMIAGTVDSCPVPVMTKDGERIEVETKVTRGQWNRREVLIGVTRDVTARKRAEEALERAYQEKGRLLQELQHRAKNSFAMISAMVALMADATQSGEAQTVLAEINGRVRAISELYDMLYTTDTITKVRLQEYCTRITTTLLISGQFHVVHDLEEITVLTKIAAPLGLILTELITNAVKHAFPLKQDGIITVRLSRTSGGARLSVEDNGIGLPANFNLTACDSLGLRIVQALALEIRGRFTMERVSPSNGGTLCMVEFPGVIE